MSEHTEALYVCDRCGESVNDLGIKIDVPGGRLAICPDCILILFKYLIYSEGESNDRT